MIHMSSVLASIKQGILICNKEGKIVYFNDTYGKMLGKRLEEVAGMPISKLRPGAQVPQVLRKGRKKENLLRTEGNQEYYTNIYPILENEILTGTISIVTTIDKEIRKTQKKETLQKRVREFEKKEIEEMLFLYGYDTEGKKKVAKELGISLATLYNKLSF